MIGRRPRDLLEVVQHEQDVRAPVELACEDVHARRDGSSPIPIAAAIAPGTSAGSDTGGERHEPRAVREAVRDASPRPGGRAASCRSRRAR